MLRTVQLGKAFIGPGGAHRVFRHVEFALEPGEGLVLTGPPGSGKSTLLAILGGLLRPTQGEVWWMDLRLSHLPEHAIARVRAQHIGLLFQDFRLIRGLMAWENVALALVPLHIPASERKLRAEAALAEVNMDHRANYPVNALSGGEQQRVALARALVKRPSLLLADEPTATVDAHTAQAILSRLAEAKRAGAAVLVASHDPAVWSFPALNERRAHLQDGNFAFISAGLNAGNEAT